jgi:CoA:oxalate CoA-transferase
VQRSDSTLDGLRVLDLSQAIAGPFVGRMLADLGADVVKVEWPNGDVTNRFGPARAGLTGIFTHMNAGKRGLGVDRDAPSGPHLIRRLASRADVVIENFRPGVLDRAGLGYAELSAGNPALVMVSISGFGRTSPDSQRQAYAPVIHAESGLLARQAAIDGRPVTDLAMALADELAALHATIAVLAALNMRHRTGSGQHIDLSMLEAIVATDDHISEAIDESNLIADSRGYVWDAVGGPLLISGDLKTLWHRLSRHAGLVDTSPPASTVETKVETRRAVIAEWLATFADRPALVHELEAANLAWADIRDATNVLESPSLREGRNVAYVDDHAGDVRGVVRMPYRFSRADADVRGPAPLRGEHNRQVLTDWLGASDEEIDLLVRDGTLQQS